MCSCLPVRDSRSQVRQLLCMQEMVSGQPLHELAARSAMGSFHMAAQQTRSGLEIRRKVSGTIARQGNLAKDCSQEVWFLCVPDHIYRTDTIKCSCGLAQSEAALIMATCCPPHEQDFVAFLTFSAGASKKPTVGPPFELHVPLMGCLSSVLRLRLGTSCLTQAGQARAMKQIALVPTRNLQPRPSSPPMLGRFTACCFTHAKLERCLVIVQISPAGQIHKLLGRPSLPRCFRSSSWPADTVNCAASTTRPLFTWTKTSCRRGLDPHALKSNAKGKKSTVMSLSLCLIPRG